MAEQDEPDLLGGGVGGILEGVGGKLPEANFDLDCSDEVRSRCIVVQVIILWIASSLSRPRLGMSIVLFYSFLPAQIESGYVCAK